MFAEIFYHIVTFKFAVYEYIQAQFFLQAEAVGDFFAVKVNIFPLRPFSFATCRTSGFYIRGLRERADGGRREKRQAESFLLAGRPFGKSRLTGKIAVPNGGESLTDRFIYAIMTVGKQCRIGNISRFFCGIR